MNIALVGFMGSGKSTVGRGLARNLKFGFVDTDDLVEARAGKSIGEIFESEGEAAFRALEKKAVREAAGHENLVIACGGGVVMADDNVAALKESAIIIYLKTSLETLHQRLADDKENRPLLNVPEPESEIKRLLDERERVYEAVSDQVVPTNNKPVGRLVDRIVEDLKARGVIEGT